MPVPPPTEFINPLLAALRKSGGAARPKQVFQTIARDLALPSDVLQERLSNGTLKFEKQIAWARFYLAKRGFIDGSHRGVWKLTDKGWASELLSSDAIRSILEETRVREKVTVPDADAEPPESTKVEVDIQKLKELYGSNAIAQRFLEHTASRKRNQSETNVDRAQQILGDNGHDVTRQEVIAAFQALEGCGCGEFVTGRRGWPSRFVWSTPMISVGRAATGEQEQIEELAEESQGASEQPGQVSHSFRLRPSFTLELDLPSDLTSQEAKRIGQFVESLPFDGE